MLAPSPPWRRLSSPTPPSTGDICTPFWTAAFTSRPSQFEAGFVSIAHTDADIDRTIVAVGDALASLD